MSRLPGLRSLRGRVLLAALTLVIIALSAVNSVAWLTVRDSLLTGVDRQLRSIPAGPRLPATGQSAPGPTAGVGQGIGPSQGRFPVTPADRNDLLANLVVTQLDAANGDILSQLVGPSQTGEPKPDLSSLQAAIRAGRSTDQLQTIPGVGDPSYQYRARTLPPRDGVVVVVATSLATVRASIDRLVLVDAGVSLAVVCALIGVGLVVMRIGLRPLADVEHAAEQIAGGDLTVRAEHADRPGEVGSLARSFNRMIGQIDEAFQARHASEQQLRTFLADVSHELRTPLTSIRAYAELFRRQVLHAPPESITALARIESEATRMSDLVDDLLTLARLDQQRERRSEPVDLDPLVRDCVHDIAATAPNHTLRYEPAPLSTRTDLHGDPAGLRQVIGNLLTNAVRHTPPGTTVTARLWPQSDYLVLEVSDDGPGLAPEVAAHAFDRFYRPDPGRRRGPAGTGLGLAIVKSQTEAHSGHVELTTHPGQGTRITITLPRQPRQP